jgi:hypothetical protein
MSRRRKFIVAHRQTVKETDKGALMSVRRFLKNAGVGDV